MHVEVKQLTFRCKVGGRPGFSCHNVSLSKTLNVLLP